MRAAVIDRFGPPEVLHIVELPVPQLSAGEVLVRVHAAGVNAIDWLSRGGDGPGGADFPVVLGWDVSGTIAALGEGVTGLAEGDEVFGMLRFPSLAGGYAEYVAAPADQVIIKPGNVDHHVAAGAPMAGITAWQALFRQAGITPGQRVLVHGAAGGVGHVAVQLAKLAGAEVIGTASARNHDFLTELGADQVIDYNDHRVRDEVSDVDVVIEPRGGADFLDLIEVVRPGGVIVTLKGERPEYRDPLTARGVRGGYVYVGPDRQALSEIARTLGDGALRIEIERTLPLAQVATAHTIGEAGHVRGRIVLDLTRKEPTA
ncbi:NADPH:quinone reductase-like Zn-dependent oxidoreductase [Nocardia sp. GAS34]|uniref:NADP-dependent oxidoreductase n=1 Tax=Nocardia sp. GAS34 TaxID=3156305 RepID=UPI003D1CDE43